MCSIVGMGLQRGYTFNNVIAIRNIITRLLVNGMSRGRTATGVCYTSDKNMVIVKNKLSADDFVQTDFYSNSLNKYVRYEKPEAEHLLSVLGHCRQKTQGSEDIQGNNHPIHYGNVVGIHNGIITNDDVQFAKYKEVFPRKAQVDSEIIFALIDHFSTSLESITEGIQRACECLCGGYACAMVHRHQPHILWLFKANGLCTIHHFKETGIIMFASMPCFINEAVSGLNLGEYKTIELDSYEGIGIDLYRGKYQKFDLTMAPHINRGFL